MKVTSGLADVDFKVHSICREGSYLVVRDADCGTVLPTVVYIAPEDIVAALKALFTSPAALWLILSAPFRGKSVPLASGAGEAWNDEVNNPWL